MLPTVEFVSQICTYEEKSVKNQLQHVGDFYLSPLKTSVVYNFLSVKSSKGSPALLLLTYWDRNRNQALDIQETSPVSDSMITVWFYQK